MKKLKLEEILEGIEDSRRENSVQYPLHEVLFIMIIAIMCGATSYAKIEMFGNGREKWTDLNGIGMIIAKVEENGRKTEQRHYFIYSCKNMTAQEIMRAKRAHWGIENSLHWVLDIAFREDESRARKGDSAENFNILRQIVINILKLDSSFKESIPNKQFRCLLDSDYLDRIVDLWICS